MPDIRDYLTRQFKSADEDGSGTLDSKELEALLQGMALQLEGDQIHSLIQDMDDDGSGHISWEEFVSLAPALLQRVQEAQTGASPNLDWCELPASGGSGGYY